jgi:hypothetical protein
MWGMLWLARKAQSLRFALVSQEFNFRLRSNTMKKITATLLGLLAVMALTLSANVAKKGDCCPTGDCCKGGACCRTHHVK